MNGKKVTDSLKKVKLTPEQQKKYDDHYDKLSDRGGMSHKQIHTAILKKLGVMSPK